MKILLDKNVNLKKFKVFNRENSIKCELWTLRGETEVKTISNKSTSLMILGKTPLGNRLYTNDGFFEEVKKIIGNNNLGDVLHVESAIFNECDYLITEDKDILAKREELLKVSKNPQIMNFEEFKREFIKKT